MRARGEAERASLAKTRLMAALAHDLHQPLATLRLHLESLAEDGNGSPHVFEEFYRGDAPGDGLGLGLGLSTVAALARLLDHPVQVRSRPGRGTVFSLRIPRPR